MKKLTIVLCLLVSGCAGLPGTNDNPQTFGDYASNFAIGFAGGLGAALGGMGAGLGNVSNIYAQRSYMATQPYGYGYQPPTQIRCHTGYGLNTTYCQQW